MLRVMLTRKEKVRSIKLLSYEKRLYTGGPGDTSITSTGSLLRMRKRQRYARKGIH